MTATVSSTQSRMMIEPEELAQVLKVGWWASFCCEEDAFEIESVDDLEDTLAKYRGDFEEGIEWAGFWPTYEGAMADLKSRW